MPRTPVVRTPFTYHDKALIRALGSVRYSPGSAAKRFARDMNAILDKQPDLGMSWGQRRFMRKVSYVHRRQLPMGLRPIDRKTAEELTRAEIERDNDMLADGIHEGLLPTEADLAEMHDYEDNAIREPDISIASSSNPQPKIHQIQMVLLLGIRPCRRNLRLASRPIITRP